MQKRCLKCRKNKIISEFNFKNKAKNRRNTRCKICTRADIRSSYYQRRDYYIQRAAQRNRKYYLEAALHIYKYLLTHPCVDCGLADPRVLQFDHVRGKKIGAIGDLMSRRRSLAIIKAEIKKCLVRCANCHSVKTAKEQGYYAYIKQQNSLFPEQ